MRRPTTHHTIIEGEDMMTIRTVHLHAAFETLDPTRGPAAYALGLAGAFEAHLEALVLELDVITPKCAYGRQIAAEERARVRRRNEEVNVIADALRTTAKERSVDIYVITDRSHIHSTPEIATDHARLADVAVAGVCDEGLLSERMVAEALIFQSGRPVIIVPADHEAACRVERIVVAWDFSRVAARALSDALPLLRRAGEVTLVCFGDDKDFSSSLTPEDVVAALRRRDVEASFRQMKRGSRHIGEAINAAAAESQADLLVMGGFGHSRVRDFVLGGATRSVLSAPRLPSLISH
jgi:nucleotide-binding universal stress UspA family protein